ncbi:MAG TPA: twin-arginine translocase TatA/TatE family subunit [Candidatus Limnocylindria bacterium]|jgi:sec-independent protein translocase protein TatA
MPVPGPMELILLLVIVLIIFGPGKLPDIGNAVGKGIREFRKASSELEDSVRGETKRPDEPKPADGSDRSH